MQMVPTYGTMTMAYFRMFIGAVCFVLFVISYSCGAASMKHFTGIRHVHVMEFCAYIHDT